MKDQLQLVLEGSNAAEYKENDTDLHTVCKLAEDVRDVVIDYQVSSNLVIALRMRR